MTLANASIIGSLPHALFIDTHNRIYAVNHENGQIHVWLDDEFDSYIILYGNLKHSKSVFVTTTGDIYVNNAETNHQVEKFTLNSNKSVPVMLVPGNCYGLFVDNHNNSCWKWFSRFCSKYASLSKWNIR